MAQGFDLLARGIASVPGIAGRVRGNGRPEWRGLPIALAVLGALLCGQGALAASLPDTTEAFMLVVTDTKAEFRANGIVTVTDRDEPPNGFNTGVLDIEVQSASDYWSFTFGILVDDWCIQSCNPRDGAHNTSMRLIGDHLDGPHDPPGPPVDDDPNSLVDAYSGKLYANYWGSGTKDIVAQERCDHPLVDEGNPHHDLYGVKYSASAEKGPPHMLSGDAELAAKHVGDKDKQQKIEFGACAASTDAAGADASYDATSGTLTLHLGSFNVLNSAGSMSPGLDPAYVADPILNAHLGDVVLHYVGPTLDGGYRFIGGHVSLMDPEGELTLEGDPSEYLIYDTSLTGTIDSYAIFSRIATSDAGMCRSAFLGSFNDLDIMGETLSSSEWLDVQGVALTFITPANLALMTAGFTLSVGSVPATVGICALKESPDLENARPDSKQGRLEPGVSDAPSFALRATGGHRVAR